MIRIYFGRGTSKIAPKLMRERFASHSHGATFIDAEQIRNELSPQNTEILIFGGQSVTQFKETLGPDGINSIKNYVENGGHYVGICAGGYFGAEEIDFVGQYPNSKKNYKKQTQGLGFFKGTAKGSLREVVSTPFTGMSDSIAVPVLKTGKNRILFQALYWGGPQFIIDKSETSPRILSTFETDTTASMVMGVQSEVGQNGGRATLLGYHPEISSDNVMRWILPKESIHPYTAEIKRQIKNSSLNTHGIDYAFTIFRNQLGLISPRQTSKLNSAHPV